MVEDMMCNFGLIDVWKEMCNLGLIDVWEV